MEGFLACSTPPTPACQEEPWAHEPHGAVVHGARARTAVRQEAWAGLGPWQAEEWVDSMPARRPLMPLQWVRLLLLLSSGLQRTLWCVTLLLQPWPRQLHTRWVGAARERVHPLLQSVPRTSGKPLQDSKEHRFVSA